MKLDVRNLRLMSKDDFRVLTAIEMGMKNHEYVPFSLVSCISGLSHGKLFKVMSQLGRFKLTAREQKHYDGYRLTYAGYDFLALRAMVKRGTLSGVGRRIGVGKESDIYLATNAEGDELALKLHRLGRISFRRIKEKRDYLRHRKHGSWLYLSRLAALKEYSFMQALHTHGFPVPEPMDSSRHCVLMRKVDGFPMHTVKHISDPAPVFDSAAAVLVRLARCGLVHCDFNEFNLMVSPAGKVTLIDFPQMISVDHHNAEELFARDAQGLVSWFAKKYGHEGAVPPLSEILEQEREDALDVQAEASGFSKEMQKEMEDLVRAERSKAKAPRGEAKEQEDEDDEDDEDEEEDEDDEEEDEDEMTAAESKGINAISWDDLRGAGEDAGLSALAFAVGVPDTARSQDSRPYVRVPDWKRRLFGSLVAKDVEAQEEAEAAAEALIGGGSKAAAAASSSSSSSSPSGLGAGEASEGEEDEESDEPDAETLGRVPDGLRMRLHGRGRGRSGGPRKGSKLTQEDVRQRVRQARGGKRFGKKPGAKSLRSGIKSKNRRQAKAAIQEGMT